MSDFSVDIAEIISFIECLDGNSNGNLGLERCIDTFTKLTGEAYLDERAERLKQEIITNANLQEAFYKLSRYCCGEYKKQCESCMVRKYCNTFINDLRKLSEGKLKVVDLFCGAGGLSLGFVQEGFSVALANDIEACCVDTYAHNHPETPRDKIILGDIREVVDKLEQLVKSDSIDVVVGGPPCQGFSMANRQRIIDDPRNYLYKNYIEVVRRVKPKFFIMENVKGMLGVSTQVKEDFEAVGYTVECYVFNAKDFGAPQNRERLIYIGNRLGFDNSEIIQKIISKGNEIPQYVLSDALFGLRPLNASTKKNSTEVDSQDSGRKIERAICVDTNSFIDYINCGRQIRVVCNHKARYNNERDIEIYRRLNQGDKSDDPKIADIMPYASRNDIFKDKYFKLEENKICKTITAHMKFDCNMYIHPTQARGLTPREAARVQTYPDDYYFRGAYTKTYMQIGNSVPPVLSRAIASIIKQYL